MSKKNFRLLINLGPLKKGGGQSVALNFIQELVSRNDLSFTPYFIACEEGDIKPFLEESKLDGNVIVVSRNPILRILQEATIVSRFIQKNDIDLVYSYFGFGVFSRSIKQVIGSADSNLYFPEIDFWSREPFIEKILRYLVDCYRVWGLKRAEGVIFENKAMFDRSTELFGIKNKALILPSINVSSILENLDTDFKRDTFKVLLLCSWQRNKNILSVPYLARELKARGVKVEFIVTATPDGSSCSNEFDQLVNENDVGEYIRCIGPVSKQQLPTLYDKIDAVLLLSLLESFSNNIIESWYFEKPLIISDQAWARSICFDAACYVDRDNAGDIADAVEKLIADSTYRANIIKQGNILLSTYPTIAKRFDMEIEFLERSL